MAGDDSSKSRVDGTLDRVVYQNADSHWTVARLIPEGGGDAITIVGNLFGLSQGTPISAQGEWVDDARYGRQFRLQSYQTKTPETLLGIERYLGSGLIPGIGPELAKRIVDTFGLATLTIIADEPKRLTDVEGIGKARANSISRAWVEQRDIQEVMVFLRGHGVSTAYAVRIFKRYGQEAIAIIRENPYRLALDIWGIGFRTADGIARHLGIATDAPERIEAGLVHVLGECAEDGHLHVPRDVLITKTAELLAIGDDLLEDGLVRLRHSNLIIEEQLGERGACISLLPLWEIERDAAASFARLATAELERIKVDLPAVLDELAKNLGVTLAPAQKRAIEAAVVSKCLVITGGPGVGKTTIVRAIVGISRRAKRRLALGAPTGRAAKRLSESTGEEALTIHRLLEFQPQNGSFERNGNRPLDADLVIIDEASMLDTELFRALVVAIPVHAQLILVGDIDQLPSVGPGSVLADVIRSDVAGVVRLTEIFRQAAASQIVVGAHQVNQGQMPELAPPPGADPTRSDFYFVGRDDPVSTRDTVIDLVAERIPRVFGFEPLTEIQVLTPMHRGELGTQALNMHLQNRLNPERKGAREVRRGDRVYRVGDKVMQIRNDYDKDVYNGDIGVISSVDDEALYVVVGDGRTIAYKRDELDRLTHAFAVSVHKSQGSEYPVVVMPLATQHYMMLQRNLLYTAITRGKKLVVVVGSKRAVSMAVRNESNRLRWTWLCERIRAAM
jgi:exodeoxyribonuclease V alpha subunit